MTPQERTMVQVLAAVAWADGEMEAPETGVIEGLLAGFEASPEEEAELTAYASVPRRLGDIDVSGLSADDRDTLLRNAALLVCADGVETEPERRLFDALAELLGMSTADAGAVVRSVRSGLRGASRGD